MHNLEERYRSHTSDLISNKQTEVLRANKVLREVARGLGADWRFVFKYLMAGRPKEVIDIEMEKLERVKPFMQVNTRAEAVADKQRKFSGSCPHPDQNSMFFSKFWARCRVQPLTSWLVFPFFKGYPKSVHTNGLLIRLWVLLTVLYGLSSDTH